MTKPGPTVSSLLFGGFIEHMGRVIDGNFGNDGGIWAEYLADRKFFFSLSPKKPSGGGPTTLSPWRRSSGPGSSVTAPRLPEAALVRGGRVVAFRFPCGAQGAAQGGQQGSPGVAGRAGL